MKGLPILARHFLQLTQPAELVKLAGRENRKSIEKKLRQAKQIYDTRRASLQGKRKQYEDLACVIDKESQDMNDARDYMRKAYDVLKNMDLVDAHEVKFIGKEDVAYVQKGRLYSLKIDENGQVELKPLKKKQLPENDPDLDQLDPEEEETQTPDSKEEEIEDLDVDEILHQLIEE